MKKTLKKIFLAIILFASFKSIAQKDTTKWVRAFPITNYIVDASDSIRIVQLLLPDGVVIADKQLGLLKGMYRDKLSDTAAIGTGRCNLVKGNYYYFTINNKKSGIKPREGDLMFVLMDKPAVYAGKIIKLASHFIGLQNINEKPFYNRYDVFYQWSKTNEELLVDSMLADIHYTGDYFLKNSPGINVNIKSGKYEGKPVLNIMITSNRQDVTDFLDYMTVRPYLYAGHEWKISEIFATWLSEGAPTVVK